MNTGDQPGQSEQRTDRHQQPHNAQIQVIRFPFLKPVMSGGPEMRANTTPQKTAATIISTAPISAPRLHCYQAVKRDRWRQTSEEQKQSRTNAFDVLSIQKITDAVRPTANHILQPAAEPHAVGETSGNFSFTTGWGAVRLMQRSWRL